MARILTQAFIGFLFALPFTVRGQFFDVQSTALNSVIGASFLSPPNKAGANFPIEFLLPNRYEITIDQIAQTEDWCMCAAQTTVLPGPISIALWPDVSTYPPRDPGVNAPVQPVTLNSSFQPVFSYRGPLFQKSIQVYLQGATVQTAIGQHELSIVWQLRKGPCNFL